MGLPPHGPRWKAGLSSTARSFAAYAASKAALNHALRVRARNSSPQSPHADAINQHMAAELKRKGSKTIVLAMHPGEVAT